MFSDFMAYKSGVYSHQSGIFLGGHAIKVLGWGTNAGVDYWIVANRSGSFSFRFSLDFKLVSPHPPPLSLSRQLGRQLGRPLGLLLHPPRHGRVQPRVKRDYSHPERLAIWRRRRGGRGGCGESERDWSRTAVNDHIGGLKKKKIEIWVARRWWAEADSIHLLIR